MSPVKVSHSPNVAGTTWRGADSDGEFLVCAFEPSGRLQYTTPTGKFRDGSWHQRGAAISMAMNDHYAEYTGTIDGSRMSGKAKNVVHKHWTWELRRTK